MHAARNETTLCASLELSHKTWLLTVLSPGTQKMSKFSTPAGDGDALIELLDRLRSKAEGAVGDPVGIAVIQEAGLDGFWVHRLLEARQIESLIVDPASIAVPRRQRRAKTDVIDGETLLRTLLAWRRGEPRVCAMVVPMRKIAVAPAGNVPSCFASGSGTSTGSRGCCRARGSSISNRWNGIVGHALRN